MQIGQQADRSITSEVGRDADERPVREPQRQRKGVVGAERPGQAQQERRRHRW